MEPEQVLASTVVFTRSVGGVAVVGPGSKIAVTFANDGTPVAFDVDWAPYYTAGPVQAVLPVDRILGRSRALGSSASEEKLDRMECGYLDLGGRKRSSGALLQAGCFLQLSIRTPDEEGHFLTGLVEAVPAGAVVLPDPSWPEAPAAGRAAGAGGLPGGYREAEVRDLTSPFGVSSPSCPNTREVERELARPGAFGALGASPGGGRAFHRA